VRVVVINTGTELLLGEVLNTHLRFIAREIFSNSVFGSTSNAPFQIVPRYKRLLRRSFRARKSFS
jgi:Predicted nucleotide-utilizing enzyme related to molybdopterin-biosynthesis enzyme MoeA